MGHTAEDGGHVGRGGCICEQTDFVGLQSRWNKILALSAGDTIFQTWEWLSAWWKHFGGERDSLLLFTVKDAHGDPFAIVPLYISTVRFRWHLSLRCIRFLGDGSEDSDYLDFISVKGREKEALTAIFDHLLACENTWEVMLLSEIPENSPTLEILPSLGEKAGMCVQKEEILCASVLLTPAWESYLRTLKPRFRTKVRAELRYLESSRDARVEMCQHRVELDSYLCTLFTLHQKRWTQLDEEGSFHSPARRRFYRDFTRSFLAQGWLRFYRLGINGKTASTQIGFEYNNRFFQLQEGFNPDYGNLSVGVMLRAFIMRDLIAKGVKEYDFLGGFNQSKEGWGARPKRGYRLVLAKPSVKAYLLFTLTPLLARSKERMKKICPASLLKLRRKWLIYRKRGARGEVSSAVYVDH
jgi:CelD/BcsL family acetyltransferase involved in cellulose biosynthesis